MSTANNTQVGGQHYKAKTIQPWDYIAANGLGYFEARGYQHTGFNHNTHNRATIPSSLKAAR